MRFGAEGRGSGCREAVRPMARVRVVTGRPETWVTTGVTCACPWPSRSVGPLRRLLLEAV